MSQQTQQVFRPRGRPFTSETGQSAAWKSRASKRYLARVEKELGKMGITKTEIEGFLAWFKAFSLSPFGSFISAWLIIDLLDKIGFFKKTTQTTTVTSGAPPNNLYSAFLNAWVNDPLRSLGWNIDQVLSGIFGGAGTQHQPTITTTTTAVVSEADTLKTLLASAEVLQALGGIQGITASIGSIAAAIK